MQNLLRQPSDSIVRAIDQVMDAIDKAAPIPRARSRNLPNDIRDLSQLLTEERGGMDRPYWASIKLFSAYVHYFMPWNLFRLSWLLPSLSLPLQPEGRILDLGSGPLTMPLALWCARPELRSLPLHFVCADVANQPMEMGLSIFEIVTEGKSPWRFECVRAPLDAALAKSPAGVDCIMAGNVLNEIQPSRGQTLAERIAGIVHAASRKLSDNGTLLLVEPGTRLGGKVAALAREVGVDLGMHVQAPCTHHQSCPMCKSTGHKQDMSEIYRDSDAHKGRHATTRGKYAVTGSQVNMWCHFNFPVQGAPARLARLTALAKFDRRNLALSCAVLNAAPSPYSAKDLSLMAELDELEALYNAALTEDARGQGKEKKAPQQWTAHYAKYAEVHDAQKEQSAAAAEPAGEKHLMQKDIVPPLWARIISGPIQLPGETEQARYGCAGIGLVLVRQCARIPHGGAVLVNWDTSEYDTKSGAQMVQIVKGHGQKTQGKGEPGRKQQRQKELDGKGRKQQDRDKSSAHKEDKKGASGHKKNPGEAKGRDHAQAMADADGGLQGFFSRPKKMRERYGSFTGESQKPVPGSSDKPSDRSSGKASGKASGRRRDSKPADKSGPEPGGRADRQKNKQSGRQAHSPSSKAGDMPEANQRNRKKKPTAKKEQ